MKKIMFCFFGFFIAHSAMAASLCGPGYYEDRFTAHVNLGNISVGAFHQAVVNLIDTFNATKTIHAKLPRLNIEARKMSVYFVTGHLNYQFENQEYQQLLSSLEKMGTVIFECVKISDDV